MTTAPVDLDPRLAATAEQVAFVARLIARAGLVQAFGHVSARLSRGGFLLSATSPLLEAHGSEIIELDEQARVRTGEPDRCPLEAPLHAAVYAARPDVAAVCRTHSPAAVAWAARGQPPPLVHGLGGLAGALAFHDEPQLVTSMRAGRAAAVDLGEADCLLLRANGALCTATDLAGAAVRAFFLEERALVAERVAAVPTWGRGASPRALGEAEARLRARHHPAEQARAWSWMQSRYRADQTERRRGQSITEPPMEAS